MKNELFSIAVSLVTFGLALAGAAAGKVLILDNELMIEGDIRRDGDHYIIRRGAGETVIPANRVMELVADRHEAYQAMRRRCNRRDFDDRMHLVRWCMENRLRDEALAEAELLHQFRPDDAPLCSLVEGLRTLKTSKTDPTPAPPPAKLPDKVVEVEPLDYNRESFGLFVSRVQPIMMNVCARCHATGQGGNFSLAPVTGGSDRKATLANLAATLKQLKKSDLAASPLLEKAVTPHGKTTQPPLRDRQSPAFQYLESWVQIAVVPEEKAPAAPPAAIDVVKPASVPTNPAPKVVFGETSTSQTKPEPQTQAKDPFDPAIFNGTIQPKKD